MFFYTRAYTSQGIWDFTKDNIFDVTTSVSLNCTNLYVTDWVLTNFAKELKEDYHTIIAPGSRTLKSGLVLKSRQRAFVTNCPDATEQLELDKYFNIVPISKKSQRHWSDMEISYKKAKLVHDEWERVYINNMDFKSLDSFSQKVIETLTAEESQEGKGKVYRRFFGTTTVEGTVNFIDDITESIRKRYFIKGRPGTGKSTFLKKLSKALTEKGYDVEEYYCSFDPKSLDMVVSRELSFCVFDSTPPHEKFPERDTDEILAPPGAGFVFGRPGHRAKTEPLGDLYHWRSGQCGTGYPPQAFGESGGDHLAFCQWAKRGYGGAGSGGE